MTHCEWEKPPTPFMVLLSCFCTRAKYSYCSAFKVATTPTAPLTLPHSNVGTERPSDSAAFMTREPERCQELRIMTSSWNFHENSRQKLHVKFRFFIIRTKISDASEKISFKISEKLWISKNCHRKFWQYILTSDDVIVVVTYPVWFCSQILQCGTVHTKSAAFSLRLSLLQNFCAL